MIETQDTKTVTVIAPAAIVDNASFVTNEIDTLGAKYLDIYLALGALDIAMVALKLQESDVSGAGFVDVAGANFAVDGTLPVATDDNKIFVIHVDLRGRKRFFDLLATAGDGAAGTFAYAWAVLSRMEITPSSASERGFAQELFV